MSKLVTIFGANTSQLDAGLARARNNVDRFSANVQRRLAQAFSVYAITRFFTDLTQKLDRIGKLAARGFSTDFIQDLGLQAEKAGSSIETLLPKISALWREMNSATVPSQLFQDNLAALGLTVEALKGLTQEELFKRVIDGMRNATDRTQAMAAAMVLLRDRTGELSVILNDLAENGLAESNRASEESIRTAEVLKDAWAEVMNFFTAVAAPVLQFVVTLFANLGTIAKVAIGILLSGIETLAKSFISLGKIAKMALVFDFSGAKREVDKLVRDVKLGAATMSQVITEADNDLQKFNRRVYGPRATPMAPPALPPEMESAAPGASRTKLPVVAASSLQRIGGGGESFVAMQRDRELEQLQIIARASERTARATESFEMELR